MKYEFGKTPLQKKKKIPQISRATTIRSNQKLEIKLKTFSKRNKVNSHTKTLFQLVTNLLILQMCIPKIKTRANAWFFSMITTNNSYSYGSIFVTFINFLWVPLKVQFFFFCDGRLSLAHHQKKN